MSLIPFDYSNLFLCAVVTITIQLTFYAIAATLKFDKVTDFAGGTNFILLALLTLFLGEFSQPRPILISCFAVLWGIRISSFLLYRIILLGKDSRFDGTRDSPLRFLVFWIFQILWVFTVSLPVIITNAAPTEQQSTFPKPTDIIGSIIFVTGLLIETIADFQKFFFKQDQSNQSRWCDAGLWKFSRHPNYFGEITLWWGMWLIGFSTYQGAEHLAILSPLFTMTILLFLSGIPPLEKSADLKHGSKKEYVEYKRRTSPLVPLPGSLYSALPSILKAALLCEFPFYNQTTYQDIIGSDGPLQQ